MPSRFMTPDRWRRVEELFEAARPRQAADRAAFLDNACGGEPEVRAEVESLLAALTSGDSFLRSGLSRRGEGEDGLAIGTTFGPYSVLAKLGEGGMGEVYLAHDGKLGRDVALKVLPPSLTSDPERRARFAREARTLAAFSHPHVGTIYGLEEVDGRQALVLEYVPGDTLADRIARGPLSVADATAIARQIASALDEAHERGIIHRDLKPANIKLKGAWGPTPTHLPDVGRSPMLAAAGAWDGIVKVLDFGLAKARAGSGSSPDWPATVTAATSDGAIVGTPRYMSPEQARGQVVDKRADIWAFGCVLYEMITGRPAFPGTTIADTLAAILEREPDWSALPAATPPAIDRLLRRCLEKDVRRRQRDIGDAAREFDVDAAAAGRDGATASSVAASRPRWPLAALGVLAGAVTVAFGMWWLRPGASTVVSDPGLHVRVDLGADVSLGQSIGPDLAVSPDGSRIVFVSRDRLWLRRLDQSGLVELPGTSGAAMPFFSPDGGWVAFVAGGVLKKTPASGGNVTTLCDAPAFRGGSWGDDGFIVAALNALAGLSRVSATSGAVSALTTLEAGEVTHRFPQVLPGSRHVIFTSNTLPTDFARGAVRMLAIETGRLHTLQRDAMFGRFVREGDGSSFLIYAVRRALMARPWSPDTADVVAPAARLSDELFVSSNFGFARVDVSRHGLVYRLPETPSIARLHAGGRVEPIVRGSRQIGAPSLSPDGRRIAFAADDDLVVYDVSRDAEIRVASGVQGRVVTWTPDGRSLILASQNFRLAAVPVDGATPAREFGEPGEPVTPGNVAPDGRRVIVQRLATSGQWDLLTAPLDVGPRGVEIGRLEPLLVTPADERSGRFSPDGQWMAYQSSKAGRFDVYVRAVPDSGREWLVSTAGGTQPEWTPDGKALMFLGPDARLMTVTYRATAEEFEAFKPVVWSPQVLWVGEQPGVYSIARGPSGISVAALVHPEAPAPRPPVHHVTLLTNLAGEIERRLASRP